MNFINCSDCEYKKDGICVYEGIENYYIFNVDDSSECFLVLNDSMDK